MRVIQTVDYLLKDFLCKWFFKASALSNVIEQIATRTQFHDNNDVLLSLNGLIDLNDVIVSQFEQQIHFFHQLSFLNLIC